MIRKQIVPYMRYGKLVSAGSTVYKLLTDLHEGDSTVAAVPLSQARRYELLDTWSKNGVGLTKEQEEERKNLRAELPVEDLSPANRIRIINSNYQTLFTVPDCGEITLNGNSRHVVYIDDYHFYIFSDEGWESGVPNSCFHIAEFAEICEKRHLSCTPAKAS